MSEPVEPLRIGVLGVPGGWSSESLADAFRARGAEVLLIDAEGLSFDSERGAVCWGEVDLRGFDAIVIKKVGKEYGTLLLDRLELLRFVEAQGIPCFSSPERILRHMNRLSCTLAMRRAGIPVPATVVTQDWKEARSAVKRFGGAVLKPIYSTKARGMLLVKKGDKELKSKLQHFHETNPLIYVQQRVTLPGRDMGVVFLGGDYLGSYARVAAKGSWATTIRAGGKYAAADPSPDLVELARKAQAIFGLDFASVDVGQTPDGPVVFEVTAFGGFRGLHEGSNLEAATAYADYVLERMISAREEAA